MIIKFKEFEELYFNENPNHNSYKFKTYSERFRVGYETYTKPLKDYRSDGVKYTLIPQRFETFRKSLNDGVDHYKVNKKFSENELKILDKIKNLKPYFTYLDFEHLIKFLSCDTFLKKKFCKSQYSFEENIRSYFHLFINPYPSNFFEDNHSSLEHLMC